MEKAQHKLDFFDKLRGTVLTVPLCPVGFRADSLNSNFIQKKWIFPLQYEKNGSILS